MTWSYTCGESFTQCRWQHWNGWQWKRVTWLCSVKITHMFLHPGWPPANEETEGKWNHVDTVTVVIAGDNWHHRCRLWAGEIYRAANWTKLKHRCNHCSITLRRIGKHRITSAWPCDQRTETGPVGEWGNKVSRYYTDIECSPWFFTVVTARRLTVSRRNKPGGKWTRIDSRRTWPLV